MLAISYPTVSIGTSTSLCAPCHRYSHWSSACQISQFGRRVPQLHCGRSVRIAQTSHWSHCLNQCYGGAMYWIILSASVKLVVTDNAMWTSLNVMCTSSIINNIMRSSKGESDVRPVHSHWRSVDTCDSWLHI